MGIKSVSLIVVTQSMIVLIAQMSLDVVRYINHARMLHDLTCIDLLLY